MVPGSLDFSAEQSYLQPPDEQTDIVHVIKGVIEAESGAIEHYNQIIEFTEGKDPVTQDMVIAHPPRRGGPPAPVRGLPARVQGGGAGLAPPWLAGPVCGSDHRSSSQAHSSGNRRRRHPLDERSASLLEGA